MSINPNQKPGIDCARRATRTAALSYTVPRLTAETMPIGNPTTIGGASAGRGSSVRPGPPAPAPRPDGSPSVRRPLRDGSRPEVIALVGPGAESLEALVHADQLRLVVEEGGRGLLPDDLLGLLVDLVQLRVRRRRGLRPLLEQLVQPLVLVLGVDRGAAGLEVFEHHRVVRSVRAGARKHVQSVGASL